MGLKGEMLRGSPVFKLDRGLWSTDSEVPGVAEVPKLGVSVTVLGRNEGESVGRVIDEMLIRDFRGETLRA